MKIPVRKITSNEFEYIKAFQDFLKLQLQVFYKTKKQRKFDDENQFIEFKKQIQPFYRYDFANDLKKWIKQIDDHFSEQERAINTLEVNTIIESIPVLMNLSDLNKSYKIAKSVKSEVEKYKLSKTKKSDILDNYRNPYYVENPLFFQTTDFIHQFEYDDIVKISNKDLKVYSYTYMDLPKYRSDNFQYIVHWIDELVDKEEAVELTDKQFLKRQDYRHDPKSEYYDLIKLVRDYLYDGDKNKITKAMSLLSKFPELVEKNEKSKKKISKVYRGIPMDKNDTSNEVIRQDKTKNMVATTVSYPVARRFALKVGHLEHEENRRSETGIILTYHVDEKSIILDTKIFGGLYGESEILINPKKAKLIDTNFV
ncbi:MAG: hypothetical protein WC284_12600 [Candidimonas sp.]